MAQYEILVVVNGESTRHPIAPGSEGTVIGRSRSADVRIDDPAISRRHARVYLRDGSIMVEDLGSRSGIRVHGIDTDVAKLAAGDKFAIGTYTFALADKNLSKKAAATNGVDTAPANGLQLQNGHKPSAPPAHAPLPSGATAFAPPKTPLGVAPPKLAPAVALERRDSPRTAPPKSQMTIASAALNDATQALHDLSIERRQAPRPAATATQATLPMRSAPQPEASPQATALIQCLAKRFADIDDMETLLNEVLKAAMEIASARRASLFGPLNGASRPPVVAFQARRGGAGGPPMDKVMVRGVIESRVASIKECAGPEPSQPGMPPPPTPPKPGHICVPLVGGAECVGAIYVDSPLPGSRFGGAELNACIEAGRVAGAAIVRARGRKYRAAPTLARATDST